MISFCLGIYPEVRYVWYKWSPSFSDVGDRGRIQASARGSRVLSARNWQRSGNTLATKDSRFKYSFFSLALTVMYGVKVSSTKPLKKVIVRILLGNVEGTVFTLELIFPILNLDLSDL